MVIPYSQQSHLKTTQVRNLALKCGGITKRGLGGTKQTSLEPWRTVEWPFSRAPSGRIATSATWRQPLGSPSPNLPQRPFALPWPQTPSPPSYFILTSFQRCHLSSVFSLVFERIFLLTNLLCKVEFKTWWNRAFGWVLSFECVFEV